MKAKIKKGLKKGQTMVEYILIVGLIAIALIGVVTALSRAIGKTAAGAAGKLNSDEGSAARQHIEEKIGSVDDEGSYIRTLSAEE